MSGSLSLYGRYLVLGSVLAADAVPALETLWVALTTSEPSEGDDGNDLDEPTIASYGRVAYPTGSAWWTSSGYGDFLNTQEVTWPVVSEPWPVVVGWALLTQQNEGNTIAVGKLQAPLEPADDDTLTIPTFSIRLRVLGQVG